MNIAPISLKEANAYVLEHHRHHKQVPGHKFSLSVWVGKTMHGAAIVGRPLARNLDDGYTLEVLRLCTDGYKNACSFLYSACARAAKCLGYRKIITYILQSEIGTSLIASGWTCEDGSCGGGSWDTPSRPRTLSQATLFGEDIKYPIQKKKKIFKVITMNIALIDVDGHAKKKKWNLERSH